jgi:hypothetical protein
MSSSVAVESFIRFCVDANIDHRQISHSVRKYLLSYQRNLLHKPAFVTLFGETFMNWDYVERNLPKLDCAHWLSVFKFLNFANVPRNKSVLQNIEKHLTSLKLDPSLTCQIFLLKNMNFITSQLGVERLFCEHEVADPYSKSLQFFAMSADAAFDMTEMTAVFCHIMQMCEVDEAELEKQIQFVNLREEELSTSFKVRQIRMVGARPRLRSKLAEIQKEVRSVRDMDDFDGWSAIIGFPNVFSLHMRRKLYFLMSQVHVPDPMEHVSSVTRDVYVCNSLRNAAVNTPEVDALYKAIVALKITEEPFKELHEFRYECLNAFPVTQLNTMKLNDLLHLYVCAYQHPMVWKEVWKQLVPLLSHQVIRDVETFVQKRPFNFQSVLSIMNN